MPGATVSEHYRSFVPNPLPPRPPVRLDDALQRLLSQADQAIGRLDGMASVLPDVALFLYYYVRKEALVSSQIEGTQSTLSELLLFEADAVPGVPVDAVHEVSRYVAAIDLGVARMRSGEPLTMRLVRALHGELLAAGRGSEKAPGEYRTSQNWIGGSRPGNAAYVPPPPQEVVGCMADLEKYIHARADNTPALVRAALAHAQFETIHPFQDGNGRVGRLLITLMLMHEGVLRHPLLYLSLHFKRTRDTYYDLLQRVRTEGAWEQWVRYFLAGARDTAAAATQAADRLLEIREADRAAIQSAVRSRPSVAVIHEALTRRPMTSAPSLARRTNLTHQTVMACLRALSALGIVREVTGRAYGRVYEYTRFLAVLSEGTELP